MLNEGLGRAGDEGELDVVPVFTYGVIHDGPALEQRFFTGFAREDDAIGRLPDGNFTDVADVELAIAGAFCGESHAAEILLADGGEQVKILADFVSEVGLGELDADGGSEFDAADFAGIADDGGEVDFEGGAAGNARFAFDAEQAAGDCGGAGANLQTRATESTVEFREIGFFFEREAECAEAFAERGFGIVVDAGDAAAVKVEDGERLENVVELTAGEIDADGFVAADVAEVLEIADAGLVEDDAADGEFGGGFAGRGGA